MSNQIQYFFKCTAVFLGQCQIVVIVRVLTRVHAGLERAAHANNPKRSLFLRQVPLSACFASNLEQWCLVAAEHVRTGSFGAASKGVGWFSWVVQCIRVRAYAPFTFLLFFSSRLLFWDPHFDFGLNDCEVHKPS